MEIAIFFVPKI